jgi:ABC-type ATPase with predicted acetyltransferase domain
MTKCDVDVRFVPCYDAVGHGYVCDTATGSQDLMAVLNNYIDGYLHQRGLATPESVVADTHVHVRQLELVLAYRIKTRLTGSL